MAIYNPTLWVDYQTHVNANNLNKPEQAIKQQSVDISTLSEFLTNFDIKINGDINVLSEYVASLDLRVTSDVSTLSDFVSYLDDRVGDFESSSIHINDNKPSESSETIVWIDTSDVEDVSNSIHDDILLEIRNSFKFLQTEVTNLKKENLSMKKRISDLEYIIGNGGIVPPVDPDIEGTALVFEDGTIMVFEDDVIMTFEKENINVIPDNVMTFEDGTLILFDNGEYMTFETVAPVIVPDNTMMFEDNSIMLFEDDTVMTFENNNIVVNSKAMRFEDSTLMLFENKDLMIFE